MVALGERSLAGYDVSAPEDPRQRFRADLEARLVAARLYAGRLALVTATRPDPVAPRPVEPLGADGPSVACGEVYHPTGGADGAGTYTVTTIDPETDETFDTVSVVSSGREAATYVSNSAVYLTYTHTDSRTNLLTGFLLDTDTVGLDDRAHSEIRRVQSYDLSADARAVELRAILQRWYARLPAEERADARDRVRERFRRYVAARKRECRRTGVVRVGLEDGDDNSGDDGTPSVDAAGEVLGPTEPVLLRRTRRSSPYRDGGVRTGYRVGKRPLCSERVARPGRCGPGDGRQPTAVLGTVRR